MTPGDALLMLMTLCGYQPLWACTASELKTTLSRLRTELLAVARIVPPQPPVKKLLHTVAEAMTGTAETMVDMADILAAPVKEMVEGPGSQKDPRFD